MNSFSPVVIAAWLSGVAEVPQVLRPVLFYPSGCHRSRRQASSYPTDSPAACNRLTRLPVHSRYGLSTVPKSFNPPVTVGVVFFTSG